MDAESLEKAGVSSGYIKISQLNNLQNQIILLLQRQATNNHHRCLVNIPEHFFLKNNNRKYSAGNCRICNIKYRSEKHE